MGMHQRIARLIEMIHIISSSRGWSVKKLADYFEVSEKRIYDDLKELNAANVPIVFDEENKGYTLLKTTRIPTGFLLEHMKKQAVK